MKHSKRLKAAGLVVAAIALMTGVGLAARGGGAADSGAPPEADAFYYEGVTTAGDRAFGRGNAADSRGAPLAEAPVRNAASVPGAAAPPVAADAAQKPAGGATDASTLASVDGRKIVQTAALKVQVKDVGGGFEEVGRIAAASGGYVASSNFAFQGEAQVATVTIRVPADRYQAVLAQVRALGARVDSETSNASDVTEEYSDLSARIRNLEATEQQLLQLLSQARNVSEVLQVQDRLSSVRSEIERHKGRVALLDKLTDLATITVQLRPLAAAGGGGSGGVDLGGEVTRAWEASLEFLGGIAAGVITVLVFSWWLIPLAGAVALVWQRLSRSRPAATVASYD